MWMKIRKVMQIEIINETNWMKDKSKLDKLVKKMQNAWYEANN